MNRDIESLLLSLFSLGLGAVAMVLTTSWVWPGIALALGGIGLLMALATPARDTPAAGPEEPDRLYFQG
ncbi:hypothetical protein [Nocardia crassostreae]|uniref:hypothetical protein n=1 Tax=Nocardia crassostreae TaxID=53428 RepID=UPI00082BD3E6|nr:hypothetical protein [Nocardia crassostreae]